MVSRIQGYDRELIPNLLIFGPASHVIYRENEIPVDSERQIFPQEFDDSRSFFRTIDIGFERVVYIEMGNGEPYTFCVTGFVAGERPNAGCSDSRALTVITRRGGYRNGIWI